MGNPTYTYDIHQLLNDAFGLVGFRTLPYGYNTKQPDYNEVSDLPEDIMTYTSELGTPVLMPVALDAVNWTEIVDGEKKSFSRPRFEFPDATLIDFNQAKIIERTQIRGRKGNIKEYIGMDDWMIRIRGVAVNDEHPDFPPQAFIQDLNARKEIPVAIPILNDICRWLGVTDVVIESIDFPSLEGYPGTQPFVLECSSDEIFELKYKNDL